MSLDAIVAQIVIALRDGPTTHGRLKVALRDTEVRTYPQLLDNALQKAKADGVIEYSKRDGDRRKLWRLVEHKPARKVGEAVAEAICNGAPVDHIADLHKQVKSEIDQAHDQGFEDGQQHAFQRIADEIRSKIAADAKIGCSPSVDDLAEWAAEIEAGAWAEEEASDESP